MTSRALIIRHQTLPGSREKVREIWETHLAPAVAANPGHLAYHYCFDTEDPDAITAFQVYADDDAAQEFLTTEPYRAYLLAVEPFLSGPPAVTALTPVWTK